MTFVEEQICSKAKPASYRRIPVTRNTERIFSNNEDTIIVVDASILMPSNDLIEEMIVGLAITAHLTGIDSDAAWLI